MELFTIVFQGSSCCGGDWLADDMTPSMTHVSVHGPAYHTLQKYLLFIPFTLEVVVDGDNYDVVVVVVLCPPIFLYFSFMMQMFYNEVVL